jgi:general secretion pathway protein G
VKTTCEKRVEKQTEREMEKQIERRRVLETTQKARNSQKTLCGSGQNVEQPVCKRIVKVKQGCEQQSRNGNFILEATEETIGRNRGMDTTMVTVKNFSRRGFTLIEMLVVIVVIAILAAIVLPKFQDQSRRSKESSLKSDLAVLRTAVATFQADTGYYPKVLADLTATTAATVTGAYDSTGTAATIAATDWHGPYITGSIPTDPVSATSVAFSYSIVSGTVGKVSSATTGNGLDGAAYTTY